MIEELFNTIRDGTAHQSVLIEGDVAVLVSACVTASTRKRGVTLYPITSDVWTIDHSRRVTTIASRSTDEPLCILMAGNVFTIESQHALLKVTEEALPKVFFIIITGNADTLLATLRSRLFILKGGEQGSVHAKKFLGLSLPERLTAVASAIESPEHREVYTLISELSSLCAHDKVVTESSARARTHLTRIRTFLSTHPLGMRQLLEHLALTLPLH